MTLLREKVEDIALAKHMQVDKLIEQMKRSGGFTAKKMAVGVEILEKMFNEECTTFLSFPACIIATGTRGIIKDLIKERLVDVVITTCGTLDHDLARIWKDYYHGDFLMDDVKLHQEGINRLGNVLVPNESYGIILEKKMQPILDELWTKRKKISTKELIWFFGEKLGDKSSIMYWAAKNKIPIYVPGITDGAFGFQLWMFRQEHRDFTIDLFQDEQELSDMAFDAEKTGALMIGGGISKHHTLWWNQFRGGLNYAVYITTAVEYDGSLSGAKVREGVSWGKVSEKANFVTIEGDATLILPFMLASVLDRLK